MHALHTFTVQFHLPPPPHLFDCPHTSTTLYQAGSSVTSLELSDNNLAAAAASLASSLAQLPSLKHLSLNNCSLTTWPLLGLGPGGLRALHTLELAGNNFGRSCPQDGLAACPQLKTLDLSGVLSEQEASQHTLLAAFLLYRASRSQQLCCGL